MTGAVPLDVRWPIGGLFTALGTLLAGYGLVSGEGPAGDARALSVNINLWWGLVMLAFGILLLVGAGLGRRLSVRSALETPEGRATEARERRQDLER